MKKSLAIFATILAMGTFGLGWYGATSGFLPGKSGPAAVAGAVAGGGAAVTPTVTGIVSLSGPAQKVGGVETTALALRSFQPQSITFATVLDLTPLFDLHSRIIAAQSDLATAKLAAAQSTAHYKRQAALTRDNVVAKQTLRDSQQVMEVDAERNTSAQAALEDLRATLRATFGGAILSAVTGEGLPVLPSLAAGRTSLVSVSIPRPLAQNPPIDISVDSANLGPVPARFLSKAPQGVPGQAGVAYLYVASAPLATRARLIVHIATPEHAKQGVFLPEAAILWYGGQRWVYVQTGPLQFARRGLPASADLTDTKGGLVAATGFKAGEMVVTRGAQLLLSQELRPKDIKTVCPDPPECDG